MAFAATAKSVRASNVFLNMFHFIGILKYAPQFHLMTDTLGRSFYGVAGFAFVFFVILSGFGMAYTIMFSSRINGFRTFGQSLFTLTLSLLGDFNFQELQASHGIMGPLLFMLFVGVAVFVVLNMLIAIISQAYDAANKDMMNRPKVHVLEEMEDVLLEYLDRYLPCLRRGLNGCQSSFPCCFKCFGRCCCCCATNRKRHNRPTSPVLPGSPISSIRRTGSNGDRGSNGDGLGTISEGTSAAERGGGRRDSGMGGTPIMRVQSPAASQRRLSVAGQMADRAVEARLDELRADMKAIKELLTGNSNSDGPKQLQLQLQIANGKMQVRSMSPNAKGKVQVHSLNPKLPGQVLQPVKD